MGKKRRLARQQVQRKARKLTSETPGIKLDLETLGEVEETCDGNAGDSNAFIVLPKAKGHVGLNEQDEKKKRKRLTPKERRRLQKIVEIKEKKAKRARLFESLAQHAVSSEEASLLRPTVVITKGRETRKEAEVRFELEEQSGSVVADALKNVACKRRRKRKQKLPGLLKRWAKNKEKSGESEKEGISSDDLSDISTDDDCDEEEEKEDEPSILMSKSDKLTEAATVETKPQKDSERASTLKSNERTKAEEELQAEKSEIGSSKPALYVTVERDPDIQMARLNLPILGEEQEIMEAIHENDVVIICGETGSGKTTQVPQFLYEAGYGGKHPGGPQGLIGITEPRRVAAISMSKRVAHEMGLSTRIVSYQIRYESNVSGDTAIKFMTDGVLLREAQQDFLLLKYSVVIIDEAHERSVFTDILIGLLSRIVLTRRKRETPLKLIIMSATLRVEDFTANKRLFSSTPPIIQVQSRQYPVTVHFSKTTPDDYTREAYRKVCKIHRTLPAGGILVFVTGRQEVYQLCQLLRSTFPTKSQPKPTANEDSQDTETNGKEARVFDLDKYSAEPAYLQRLQNDLDGSDVESEAESESDESDMDSHLAIDSELPLHVLPLYSLLSSEKQARIFDPPPAGCRLCVVSTNVAETSLTIPDVTYVVDTGMVKHKLFDPVTGISSFRVGWTSKASANQRAGRAGRTSPGHCYRLFSSAVFQNELDDFSCPEIVRRPSDDLVLQMKTMGITKIANFPFPTPPQATAIEAAEKLLFDLEALSGDGTCVSAVGQTMSKFPVSPRYAKMLAVGHQYGCLPYVVTLVAAISARELLSESNAPGNSTDGNQVQLKWLQQRKSWAGQGEHGLLGDLMVLLRAVGACEYSGKSEKFCLENGIRPKSMVEVRKLRVQLTNAVNKAVNTVELCVDPKMPPPSQQQARVLRQIALAGSVDHIAKKMTVVNTSDDVQQFKDAYETLLTAEPVYIHPTSVLGQKKPDYVVFQELFETDKIFMRGVSAVEPEWLPVVASSQCTFSKPLEQPPPRFDTESGTVKCHRSSTFGSRCWMLPAVELDYPYGLDKFKWFARFLLEGKVVEKLSGFSSALLSRSSVMIKSWSKLHKRTESLLASLVDKDVCSRTSLLEELHRNDEFLLREYLQWLPDDRHNEIKLIWSSFKDSEVT